jgi:hypothetical protein
MRLIAALGLALFGLLTLVGCDTPPKARRIVAGPVEAMESDPLRIHGSFRIEEVSPGHGISSFATGGACLVANLNPVKLPADKGAAYDGTCNGRGDTFCNDLLPANLKADTKTAWHSYCIDNICWTRPGSKEDFCEQSAMHNGRPWGTGWFNVPIPHWVSVRKLYADRGVQGKVKWRVLACLNGTDSAGAAANTACAGNSGEKMLVDGDVAQIGN